MVGRQTAGLLSLLIAPAIVAILTTAPEAAPTTLAFSYTFYSGRVLAGSLVAEIRPDGDTVFIESFGSVTFDGVALPSIEPSEIRSVSDFPRGLLHPLISFSGLHMDVFVCPQGFLDGNCIFETTGGFYFNWIAPAFLAGAGDGQSAPEFNYGDFRTDRWVLVPVLVPEPVAASLLTVGLGGLVARRASERHRRSA